MLLAFFVTLAAGLATSIGGVLAVGRGQLSRSRLAIALAFAAGAMILVSFVEILPKAIADLSVDFDETWAQRWAFVAFFAGILAVMGIDRVLPHQLNPAETVGRESDVAENEEHHTLRLMRSGLLVALVLGLHNFPEGMATFAATYSDPSMGMTLAFAIAIHNIPEGIAVAAPIYAATGSRAKALGWSTLSGMAEPIGAVLAAALLAWVIPAALFGLLFAFVGGMMVFLALDELLPGSWRYQTDKHETVYGMLAGMGVVAASLVV